MNKGFQTIKLPSLCRTYQGVDPESISIRTLTGEEERILAETKTSNYDRKILEVLKNVVQGIDVSRLTVGDRLYLLVWELMNSFSDDLPIIYICTNCGRKVDTVGKLSSVEVKTLPKDYTEPVKRLLSDGRPVNLRLLTAGDEIKVSDYEASGGEDWIYRNALSIVSDEDILKRMELYKSLPIKDTAIIRSFQEEFKHGPDMMFKLVCPECNEEDRIYIPFQVEFLIPTGEELIRNFGGRTPAHASS
jgi:hypothetical protein